MDNTKLQAAIQKQDEYTFTWGHLNDVPVGDETFDDLTRKIIQAFKERKLASFMGT